MEMALYDRYVDDSNQLAETIHPCLKYNVQTGKLVVDDNQDPNEEAETRTVRVLNEVANSVQHGIVMEADHPNKNEDNNIGHESLTEQTKQGSI